MTIRRRRGLNEYVLDGDICRIKVYGLHWKYNGDIVIDANDVNKAQELCWSIGLRRGKPTRAISHRDGHHIRLHHWLFGKANDGLEWDHINRNPLDNRRENLRQIPSLHNNWNQGMRRNNTSGFKGVGFYEYSGRWKARASVNRKTVSLGIFDTKEEAASAYDKFIGSIRGQFAVCNMGGA